MPTQRHTHAGRYACNPQQSICSGPLTPRSGGGGSSLRLEGTSEKPVLPGKTTRCRRVSLRVDPTSWYLWGLHQYPPLPLVRGGEAGQLRPPIAPHVKGLSDEASFRVGCGRGGQEKGREAERENQYIHSIPQCTHFLTVWPYLITDIKARAHTPKGLYIFQSIFRRQTNVDVVLENELTFSLTYCTHGSIGNVATAPAQAGDKWFTLLAPHISQYAHWTCNEPACTVVLEAGQRCLKVLKEKRWDGYMKRNGVCVDVHGWLTAYMSTNAWCGPS